MKTSVMLAGAALLIGGAVTAQTAAPAGQPPAATVTPVQPEAAAPPTAIAPAPGAEAPGAVPPDAVAPGAVTTAESAVTKEHGKYVKDGRPATRTEIALYKKAAKSKPE